MSDRAVQGASLENWCVNITPWVRIPPYPVFSDSSVGRASGC